MNILNFIKDPKNTRMIILGAFVILILLFLHQCSRAKNFKQQVQLEKMETQRIGNNYEAAMDTIRQGKLDKDTWRAEKLGYELTENELRDKYAELLGDFELEKNKAPKTIIKTKYEIRESITNVPVFIEMDDLGNSIITFKDSTRHNLNNYRELSGKIPYKIVIDPVDSTYRLVPGLGAFDLSLGMNLNLGLFQDKKTRKINIVADTDYPGVTFTKLEGASIMDDPRNKKIMRGMRKTWGLGVNLGYGLLVNPGSGSISTGPYLGVGLSYNPKFLQWGK